MSENTTAIVLSRGLKAKAYFELLKPRLSLLVAFSCAFGYSLASGGDIDWSVLTMLTFGGFLLSGASVSFNQVMERNYDKVMTRTMHRPIPSGRVNVNEAMIFSFVTLILSVVVLWLASNPLTVWLSVLSMVLWMWIKLIMS